jgi:hypothetical protein
LVYSVFYIIVFEDFGWDDVYSSACAHCGRVLYEGDGYYHDDNDYCEWCYNELFTYCDICDETYRRTEIEYVESSRQRVCRGCLLDEFSDCYECAELFENGTLHEHDEHWYCWQCLNNLGIPPGWVE